MVLAEYEDGIIRFSIHDRVNDSIVIFITGRRARP